jgi:predicted SAM-dependent methyltransferase
MKLNLGCGFNKMAGFVNIDKYPQCIPDISMDIESTPWNFEDNSIENIFLNHCLEHIGDDYNIFFSVIKEMYRVCRHGAIIQINVPHPRHDNFINDPTHVRIITPELLGLFSKKNCNYWISIGASNSPLAIYLDVDFEIRNTEFVFDKKHQELISNGKINKNEIADLIKRENNVVSEYKITVEVIKNMNNID